MVLEIDTARALRDHRDLCRLVDAVIGAGKCDESDWLEWKSTLDLRTREGRFNIARAVIGFANRPPGRALLHCEGCGYLVVGAEPGSCNGVDVVDPADLTQGVDEYLGHQGPAWTPTWLRVGEATVLVVVVEPSLPGSRIHCLRREFRGAPDGAIYVRRSGQTDRAKAGDLDALQDRLLAAAPPPNLTVRLVESSPISWVDEAALIEAVGRWVEQQRQEQLAAAKEVARRDVIAPSSVPPGILEVFLLRSKEDRTLDQYIAEVDQWVHSTEDWCAENLVDACLATGAGSFRIEVESDPHRFLTNLELTVHFEDQGVVVYGDQPDSFPPPARPRPFGDPRPLFTLPPAVPGPATFLTALARVGITRRHWTSVMEDGRTVVFHLDELRQGATGSSQQLYLLIRGKPQTGVLRCTWRATIQEPESALSGNFELPVTETPVDVGAVIGQVTHREEVQ